MAREFYVKYKATFTTKVELTDEQYQDCEDNYDGDFEWYVDEMDLLDTGFDNCESLTIYICNELKDNV